MSDAGWKWEQKLFQEMQQTILDQTLELDNIRGELLSSTINLKIRGLECALIMKDRDTWKALAELAEDAKASLQNFVSMQRSGHLKEAMEQLKARAEQA